MNMKHLDPKTEKAKAWCEEHGQIFGILKRGKADITVVSFDKGGMHHHLSTDGGLIVLDGELVDWAD